MDKNKKVQISEWTRRIAMVALVELGSQPIVDRKFTAKDVVKAILEMGRAK